MVTIEIDYVTPIFMGSTANSPIQFFDSLELVLDFIPQQYSYNNGTQITTGLKLAHSIWHSWRRTSVKLSKQPSTPRRLCITWPVLRATGLDLHREAQQDGCKARGVAVQVVAVEVEIHRSTRTFHSIANYTGGM